MYSQSKEEQFILDFFKEKIGTVLDIGANDGKTFSNSLALIEKGWSGVLVEPSPACHEKIRELHNDKPGVILCKYAIGEKTGEAIFHESGKLDDPGLKGADNISLVSTLDEKEKKRWEPLGMQWKEYPVKVLNWNDFLATIPVKEFKFISIDAEGVDYEILKQIDLNETKTELICIEYNLNKEIEEKIMNYVGQFGFCNVIYKSGENLLISK